MEGGVIMNWYKIRDIRINLSLIVGYQPIGDKHIELDDIYIGFDSKEERDEELRKLDEALEKGLHTLKEFKLP